MWGMCADFYLFYVFVMNVQSNKGRKKIDDIFRNCFTKGIYW